VQRRAAEMAADVIDVEKIAQARAFRTFFFCGTLFQTNISLNPIPVFEFGEKDKVIEFFLLVGK
jgi:hypothetical protein